MFFKVMTENGPSLVNLDHVDIVTAHDDPGKTLLGLAGSDNHYVVLEPIAEVERRILYCIVSPQPLPEYGRTGDDG